MYEMSKIKAADIDFLVEFNKEKKTYKNFIKLNYFLEDLFETKIDLITLKSLPKNRNFTKTVLNETIYATLWNRLFKKQIKKTVT